MFLLTVLHPLRRGEDELFRQTRGGSADHLRVADYLNIISAISSSVSTASRYNLYDHDPASAVSVVEP